MGQLDEAFTSRIHVSLGYSSLTFAQYMDVFKINIEKLEEMESKNEETVKLEIDKDNIMDWASDHFNGNHEYVGRWNDRQIRNAFVIASSLAHYDILKHGENRNHEAIGDSRVGVLDGVHFEYVAKTTQAFDEYLADTRGKHAGELAADSGNRGDMSVIDSVMNSEVSVSNGHSLGNQMNGGSEVRYKSPSPSPGFGYQQDNRPWQQQQQQPWQGNGYLQNHDGPALAPKYTQQPYGRPIPGSDYTTQTVLPEKRWRKPQPPAQSQQPHGYDTPPQSGIIRRGSYGHAGLPSPAGPGAGYGGGYDGGGGGYQQRPMMSQSGNPGNY